MKAKTTAVTAERLTSSDFESEFRTPKTLLFDVECSPHLAYVWGHWDQNVLGYKKKGYFLSVAYKFLGDKTTRVISLPDYEGYTDEDSTEKQLVEDLWKLFDEADIVVGHNARSFDVKMANSRFIKHKLGRPSFYRVIDTKVEAKKVGRFSSNSLDHLGEELGLGRKMRHQGFDLWLGCMAGDKKAWATMRRYNKQDVVLLEELYLELRQYMESHPNVAVLEGKQHACTACGSTDLTKRGKRWTNMSIAQYWQCNNCSHYSFSKYTKQTDLR